MSVAGKWAISSDGELYDGEYPMKEEAIAAAESGGFRYVGQYRAPICEEAIHAQDVIDIITCQDDYCGDWVCDDPIPATRAQLDELTAAIRQTLSQWLDKHDLRPAFGIVDEGIDLDKGKTP